MRAVSRGKTNWKQERFVYIYINVYIYVYLYVHVYLLYVYVYIYIYIYIEREIETQRNQIRRYISRVSISVFHVAIKVNDVFSEERQ